MGVRDCVMCCWYNLAHEYCKKFKEKHRPSDGENCGGWEPWDHLEDADERNEQQDEWEPL